MVFLTTQNKYEDSYFLFLTCSQVSLCSSFNHERRGYKLCCLLIVNQIPKLTSSESLLFTYTAKHLPYIYCRRYSFIVSNCGRGSPALFISLTVLMWWMLRTHSVFMHHWLTYFSSIVICCSYSPWFQNTLEFTLVGFPCCRQKVNATLVSFFICIASNVKTAKDQS